MEAIVKKIGNSFSIVVPDDFKVLYHFKERMVFEIFVENEKIILKPQKKIMREQLSKEFNLINLDDFEKYKLEILSPFLNTSSQGLELLDEE